MCRQHERVGRHHLRDRALLELVESEANRESAVIETADACKQVAQSRNRSIGIAVFDKEAGLCTA